MSNIPSIFEQQKVPGDPDYLPYLSRYLVRLWSQLARAINGGVQPYYRNANGSLAIGNIQGYIWSGAVTGPTAVVINHNLGYIPAGFLTLKVSGVTVVYFMSATNTTITVNSNAPDSAVILLVV